MCDFPSKMSHFESFSSHPLLSSFNSKPFSNHCINLGRFFSAICRIGNTNGHLRVFSLRSTEGFCEKLHNGPLKPVMPVGKLETGEWLKAIYPYLPRYKMPPWVDSELVYRQPAKEIWWSSDIRWAKGVSFIRWDTISFLQILSYPKICFFFYNFSIFFCSISPWLHLLHCYWVYLLHWHARHKKQVKNRFVKRLKYAFTFFWDSSRTAANS